MTHMIVNGVKDGVECLLVVDGENKSVHGSFKDSQPSGAAATCLISGGSSYSGLGSQGDVLLTAQKNNAAIHVHQWNKPQTHVLCRIQEVLASLACDYTGTFLIGGTKKGWLYCWEVGTGKLLNFWQGHFKTVRRIYFTKAKSPILITASEDGIAKAWDMADVLTASSASSSSSNHHGSISVQPFKVWSHHSQAITDVAVASLGITTRILTCALDRSLVVQDLHITKKICSIYFPEPLESITCTASGELVFLGASNGDIYVVSLSLTTILDASTSADSKKYVLLGHSRAVITMALSNDMKTLMSGSEDGTIRIWDVDTMQCLNVLHTTRGVAVKTLIAVKKAEVDENTTQSPFITPVGHIRKFADGDDKFSGSIPPVLLYDSRDNPCGAPKKRKLM